MFNSRYKVPHDKSLRLKDHDPADTGELNSKDEAARLLEKRLDEMRMLQDKLYAQDRWSLLLIFQAMDAAGKDSTIKHVMSGLNPQGCQVFSFKTPSAEELDHDFLWRVSRCLPERGRIGIFNRSHYEEALVVRIHPEILASQRMPPELVTERVWEERFEDINSFERHLARNGTCIRKIFLHISKKEQKQRFLERLDEPAKNWKFALGDVEERRHWDEYMKAYEELLERTSAPHAPWHIVPADHKWFAQLVVADIVVEALQDLKLDYPKLTPEKKQELGRARALLEGDKSS
jgi:PPK2 family polyphosphate:nucleotide phosphotransferase